MIRIMSGRILEGNSSETICSECGGGRPQRFQPLLTFALRGAVIAGYLVVLLALTAIQGSAATPGQPVQSNAAPGSKPARKATDLFPDIVVAKGKGMEIKRSELDEEI